MKSTLKTYLFPILFVYFSLSGFSQNIIKIHEVAIDKLAIETSGLAYCYGHIITHNDSGGLPELYVIDSTTGNITQTIKVDGIKNRDWEDMSLDNENIYVGEIGNNSGSRKDLRIFKCSKPKSIPSENDLEVLNTFEFNFEDQQVFERNFRQTPYDCEAFFVSNNTAYIFSKDWKTQKSVFYKLPLDGSTKTAQVIATLDTECMITGADFLTETNMIVCVGYKKGFPIKSYMFLMEFNPDEETISMYIRQKLIGRNRQVEGVSWVNKNTICVSNELYAKTPAYVSWYNIENLTRFKLTTVDNNNYKVHVPEKFVGKCVVTNSEGEKIYSSRIKRRKNEKNISPQTGADRVHVESRECKAWIKLY